VRFGTPDPVPFALPDGRAIPFRGAADRIDVRADGGLVVIDYKTGSTRHYAGLGGEDPTAHGRRFQLPVYAVAARHTTGCPDAPVEAAYWFVTAKGDFAWVGYAVTDDVLDGVAATLSELDALIGAGVFPPIPTAETFIPYVECPFCDPDGLGPGERRRDWERKRAAPELAPLLELIGDA
jgi:RecB family exonuclease